MRHGDSSLRFWLSRWHTTESRWRYSQPAAPWVVPPPHVSFKVPIEVTLHWPVQVMLQVPAPQTTELPAPTLWVQVLPLQLTLQLAPQLPVQVAVGPQLRLQSLVEAVHASNAQVSLAGQVQAVPEQTVSVQPLASIKATIQPNRASLNMGVPPPDDPAVPRAYEPVRASVKPAVHSSAAKADYPVPEHFVQLHGHMLGLAAAARAGWLRAMTRLWPCRGCSGCQR